MPERALSGAPAVGWHGKLPSRGDFVSGGARSELIEGWRAWAVSGMAALGHGTAARDAFLVAPLWRFACTPGFFAPAGGIGVMSPGIDRLGRPFPFVVAAELAGPEDPARALAAAEPWFAAIEPAVLAALDPGFDPVALDRRLPRPPALAPVRPAGEAPSDGTPPERESPEHHPPGGGTPGGTPSAVFVAARQDRRMGVHAPPDAALFQALFGPHQPAAVPADELADEPADEPADESRDESRSAS